MDTLRVSGSTQLRIAAVWIFAAWTLCFGLAPLRGLFWLPPGDMGATTDSSLTVTDVDPGGEAQRAGIRLGDRFDAATSFENRLYLQRIHNPRAGQLFTLRVSEKRGSRVVTWKAARQEYGTSDYAYSFVGMMSDLVFVVVASILVLLRPSKMTGAFFFYCIAAVPFLILGAAWLPGWIVFGNGIFADALRSFGFAAFLVFCARVPNDSVSGRWHYVERLAPTAFVCLFACSVAVELSILGVLHVERIAGGIQGDLLVVTYAIGILTLIATFFRQRGAERTRVGWIVAGFTVGLGAKLAANVIDGSTNMYTGLNVDLAPLAYYAGEILQLVVPLAVAYAVVRHHALNAGVIANRTLVYGLFLCGGFAAFALFDFLLTKRFARNQFEVGLDIAIALFIGLSFRFWHPRTIHLIDRIFLPDRYRAAIALDGLRTTLDVIRNEGDAPNRAVEAVAKELMLSSLAVFKKLPDGGFVRYAAAGWPKGSAWHIYAGDPLVGSFRDTARIRAIGEAQTVGLNVPAEPNKPTVGMLLSPCTTAESLILVGAHVNGRRPDQDEVRGIGALLREFARIGIDRIGPVSPAAARRSAR